MSSIGLSPNGLITIPSNYSVKQTLDRLEAALKAAGITIFARVDHQAGPPLLASRCGPPNSLFLAIQRAARR